MSDYKNLPAWKHAISLAHQVYGALEEAQLSRAPEGLRLRRAAVAVPSLIAEGFLNVTGRDLAEALLLALGKLEEVRTLLAEDRTLARGLEFRGAAILGELDLLEGEVRRIREHGAPAAAHEVF
jgi:four helix bundle protein